MGACALGSTFFSELSLDTVTFSIVNYRKFPWFVRGIERMVGLSMRRQLDDPEIAKSLVPKYGLGCKRPATSNTYLPTFNLENVDLVTEGISEICPSISREAHDQYMSEMWRRAEGTIFKADSCLTSNSYYLDSRGDASLPLPHTPWWRVLRGRLKGTDGYDFG